MFLVLRNITEVFPYGVRDFILLSDPGTEFINEDFKNYCLRNNIRHMPSPAGNKRYSGTIERGNRTTAEKERCLRTYSGLPKRTWPLSATHVILLHALNFSRSLGMTPWEAWHGQPPTIANLHVYGMECYYHNLHFSSSQGGNPGEIVRFVGYVPYSRSTYKVYRPSTGMVLETADVRFIQHAFKLVSPFQARDRIHDESDDELVQEEDTDGNDPSVQCHKPDAIFELDKKSVEAADGFATSEIVSQPAPDVVPQTEGRSFTSTGTTSRQPRERDTHTPIVRRSTRSRKPVERLLFHLALVTTAYEPTIMVHSAPGSDDSYNVFAVFDAPLSYAAAQRSADNAKWEEAMQEELTGLQAQGTWKVVDIPPDANLMRSKWVFKKKTDKDGNIVRYRARLVVKGYTQIHGVDYDETFSPVVRHSTLRIVLALCAHYGLYVHHLDVPKAFPQSDIDYDCYMSAPPGSRLPRGKCYKLLKSLYGLKQASRLFHNMMTAFLLSISFTQCTSDTCVFYHQSDDGFVIICVYVDDIAIAASSISLLNKFCVLLHQKFRTNDLGPLEWFLGIRIHTSKDRHTVQLSQCQYINDLIEYVDPIHPINSTSPVPMANHVKLSASMSPSTDEEKIYMGNIPYRTVVGKLMYVMVCTRPDIAFAVGCCARFLSNPGREHWNAVVQILKYLKGSADLQLTYRRQSNNPPTLQAFSDANWANYDVDTRRSQSGAAFLLAGACIAWFSKLQQSLALSTMDSEYYSMGDTSKEGISHNTVCAELTFPRSPAKPVQPDTLEIKVDNTSAINLSVNPVFHKRSKHIEIRHHFIRQLVQNNIVRFVYVDSANNVADVMTKPLRKTEFRHFRSILFGCST